MWWLVGYLTLSVLWAAGCMGMREYYKALGHGEDPDFLVHAAMGALFSPVAFSGLLVFLIVAGIVSLGFSLARLTGGIPRALARRTLEKRARELQAALKELDR